MIFKQYILNTITEIMQFYLYVICYKYIYIQKLSLLLKCSKYIQKKNVKLQLGRKIVSRFARYYNTRLTTFKSLLNKHFKLYMF